MSEGTPARDGGPTVARLVLHPVKSLDGQAVPEATVLPSGALTHDRAYAIVEADGGGIVDAKGHAALHRLRSRLDVAAGVLFLAADGDPPERFHLDRDRDRLEGRLGRVLGFPVRLVEDRATGFPDDADAPGPTLVGTATIEAVAGWFALDPDEVRARLRCNVEVEGVSAFWEDRLLGAAGRTVPFRIGAQRFLGVRACQRCAVPTRDSRSGIADPSFARRFAQARRAALPAWAPREQFPHFYRVTVNTRIGPGTGVLRVGDGLALGAPAGPVGFWQGR